MHPDLSRAEKILQRYGIDWPNGAHNEAVIKPSQLHVTAAQTDESDAPGAAAVAETARTIGAVK